jgi:hypothetical protein
MAVKESSGSGEERVGHHGKDAFRNACAPAGIELESLLRGKAVILEGLAYGTPILFEGDQAGIV